MLTPSEAYDAAYRAVQARPDRGYAFALQATYTTHDDTIYAAVCRATHDAITDHATTLTSTSITDLLRLPAQGGTR